MSELERLIQINMLLKRKIQATIDFYTSTYSQDLEDATSELQAISDALYAIEKERE